MQNISSDQTARSDTIQNSRDSISPSVTTQAKNENN